MVIRAVLGLFLPLLSIDHQLVTSLANDNSAPLPPQLGGLADLLGSLLETLGVILGVLRPWQSPIAW